MDPNSSHQLWSRWVATIVVPFHSNHALDLFRSELKAAASRRYRVLFGSATAMKIDYALLVPDGMTTIKVECRTEGAPAPDPVFRKARMAQIADLFGNGLRRYGAVDVSVDVFVEAGDVGDGKPPSQLVIAPTVSIH